MFCKKCGSLMLPKNGKLVCTKCGEEEEILNKTEFKLKEKGKKKKEILIVDEKINTLPTIRVECPKCKNMEAEWWLLQTRKADEPETRFFRCTKCGYTWREYG
ncbi:MAG: transcription factor S [Candidatus Hydrothermarchaeota archaeon]|nr:MAG: transcription factor S [Candidatus Hydrothermarchaeota archaeon]RLG57051.1 MAG: transcription factor S [Candidatus Hydrothermarchaeota archaeon]